VSKVAKMVMGRFYRQAEGHAEKLPWHQEQPPKLLRAAVDLRSRPATALDVGCGAGVFSVWLAEQGFRVTALDMFPEAIEMTRARAEQHGVPVELVTGDLFTYSPRRQFDLVFDSGCLHALVGGNVRAYKQQLLRWLAPGGDYILGHWGKRHPFDWRPVGPRRRSEATINHIFEPDLALREREISEIHAPFPFGPKVRGVAYWFRRKPKTAAELERGL
jgi:SAM-dependent methyltransferase